MLTNHVSMPGMARSERLLLLLQILRRHRYPVSGHVLAHETGVSLRTIYRDITALQSQGADIRGEPGIGYVLKPGFTLPPLMFTETELEALLLGLRWVSRRADSGLSHAAADVESKIRAVLEPKRVELTASMRVKLSNRSTPPAAARRRRKTAVGARPHCCPEKPLPATPSHADCLRQCR